MRLIIIDAIRNALKYFLKLFLLKISLIKSDEYVSSNFDTALKTSGNPTPKMVTMNDIQTVIITIH